MCNGPLSIFINNKVVTRLRQDCDNLVIRLWSSIITTSPGNHTVEQNLGFEFLSQHCINIIIHIIAVEGEKWFSA